MKFSLSTKLRLIKPCHQNACNHCSDPSTNPTLTRKDSNLKGALRPAQQQLAWMFNERTIQSVPAISSTRSGSSTQNSKNTSRQATESLSSVDICVEKKNLLSCPFSQPSRHCPNEPTAFCVSGKLNSRKYTISLHTSKNEGLRAFSESKAQSNLPTQPYPRLVPSLRIKWNMTNYNREEAKIIIYEP